MPFRVKVMKICYMSVLHSITGMIPKCIMINITRDITIFRPSKKGEHDSVAFFNPCMRQGVYFVKYSNKKSDNTYTQANYDTKSKCIHKTLHFEHFIS